jgi:phenylacetate-CoA ligase
MNFSRAAISPLIEAGLSITPISTIAGLISAYIAYPVAEWKEKRSIRPKLREIQRFYRLSNKEREEIARKRLIKTIEFASYEVPYYRDLFKKHRLDVGKLVHDLAYLEDIPFLTKEIIREQGNRMLSRSLDETKHYACKTGGSTGLSCHVHYDQEAADYAAAEILYARARVGCGKRQPELHFACRFPDTPFLTEWFTREDFKCIAMNRTNIFFDRLDDIGLAEIWRVLKRRKPYLVHAHPSTIYALACFIQKYFKTAKVFSVFESSGELLQPHQREIISKVLQCEVIDRYGLAELGVMAYQINGSKSPIRVLDSEGWGESVCLNESNECNEFGRHELVFTGFRNKLMPLIRYRTGDLGLIYRNHEGTFLSHLVGRIHDQLTINGINYATHYVQDILDHRVGGIQEFQIDLCTSPPGLRIVPEDTACKIIIAEKVNKFFRSGFKLEFIGHDDLVRVGRHAKFRRVIHP